MSNKPAIYDLQTLIAAGINPKTGLPIKFGTSDDKDLKEDIKRQLRILDEQNAINRYTWYNLPDGMDGRLIERILYYRAQGMFFYWKELDKFYFLPYALDGTIDIYGRFTGTKPVPFNGKSNAKKNDNTPLDAQSKILTTITRIPRYEIALDDLDEEKFNNSCVLLHDYCIQNAQTNIPRQIIQDSILDMMAECMPYMRTSLINATGVDGVRVGDDDAQDQVSALNYQVKDAALKGKRYMAVNSQIEMQMLTNGAPAKPEEFLLAMQGLDNYRLSLYGLNNGGLFQKKSHMLEAEQEMNMGKVSSVMQDGLTERQNFCNIVNSIWGLGIWCEVSESASNIDKNFDGEISDEQDNQAPADMEEETNE